MTHFSISLDGMVCMDIGASTGGVYGLHAARQGKERCIPLMWDMASLHGNCARTKGLSVWKKQTSAMSHRKISMMCSILLRWMSHYFLTKVLPAAYALLKDSGQMVCLIKPQFEAGQKKVGKERRGT